MKPQLAGHILRRRRVHLALSLRDVQKRSSRVAARLGNTKFSIPASRLHAFEMRRVVPSIYRLYSLGSIYGIRLKDLLRWYGVPA